MPGHLNPPYLTQTHHISPQPTPSHPNPPHAVWSEKAFEAQLHINGFSIDLGMRIPLRDYYSVLFKYMLLIIRIFLCHSKKLWFEVVSFFQT